MSLEVRRVQMTQDAEPNAPRRLAERYALGATPLGRGGMGRCGPATTPVWTER
jgi:hypothetical protein